MPYRKRSMGVIKALPALPKEGPVMTLARDETLVRVISPYQG